MKWQHLVLASTLAISNTAYGFFSVMDTGELLNKGYHRITADAQFITNEPNDGFNANGKFATGLNEDSDLQGEFGFGEIDFFLAGYWKWIPYPDTQRQPALGARFGFTYADINDVSTYGLQAAPIISKEFDITSFGEITPYASIPIGFQNTNDDSFLTMQFVIGTQYTHPSLRHVHFLIEGGFDIDDSIDHISIGAGFDI